MKNNTIVPEIPALLTAVIELIEAHRPVFRQARPYRRSVGLFFAEYSNLGGILSRKVCWR
jgi:hypothetical protein